MINKKLKLIVTFFTTSEAMATEKACKVNGIKGALISAPRKLAADCGISYASDVDNKEKIKQLLKDKKIEYDKILELEV